MPDIVYHEFRKFFEIENVVLPFKRGTHKVHLLDHLLPSGTQEQQAGRRIHSVNTDPNSDESYYCASMPDYLAIFNAIKNDEQPRELAKSWMRNNYLITLTRPRYNPSGKDEAIHDFGLPTQYSRSSNIIGPNGNVLKMSNKDYLFDLTGMNTEQLVELFNTINETPIFNWRKNKKSKMVEDRVARLDADSYGAGLDFDGGPADDDPCPGVKIF